MVQLMHVRGESSDAVMVTCFAILPAVKVAAWLSPAAEGDMLPSVADHIMDGQAASCGTADAEAAEADDR